MVEKGPEGLFLIQSEIKCRDHTVPFIPLLFLAVPYSMVFVLSYQLRFIRN